MISSNDNPLIKKYQKLSSKKWRHKYKIMPLEGELLINEAMMSNVIFEYALYSEDIEETNTYQNIIVPLLDRGVDCRAVDNKLFQKFSFTNQPQGIAAVVSFLTQTSGEILSNNKNGNTLILYQIGDPGNLGTLIRSADAFGFGGVICTKGCVDPTNDKVVRSSMGSLFHIPVSINSSTSELFQQLSDEKYMSVFAEPEGSVEVDKLKIGHQPLALFIGNEVHGFQGLEQFISQLSSNGNLQNCKIPMIGEAESLNAGVAGSIMMYEISKKTG